MIKIYKYKQLGHAKYDWLDSKFHFSFANYYNPDRMGFGVLRVINDDIIQPKTGFPKHPHHDMEIITYVRSGAITHKDSTGNEGRTEAGDVQVMSAGTGIQHSEYNLEDTETTLYQIWITPNKVGVEPRWDAKQFPKDFVTDKLHLLVSGRKEDADKEALFIYQDAAIYGGKIKAGEKINHNIINQAYVLVSYGRINLDGEILEKGDGAEITEKKSITLNALDNTEILVIDAPSN